MDIRNVKDITGLITYFSENLGWDIDSDDFDDIDDIAYDFDAASIGLKEESFAKISTLKELQPLVDGQKWGIFCVEFDSKKFEPSALKKILSGLVPKKRNAAEHAVWNQQDLLFICNWGSDNERTVGLAHFEDREGGLPQIKMFACSPAVEDFTQIKVFEDRLGKLAWPKNTSNIEEWRSIWSSAFTTTYKQNIQDSSTLTIQLAAEAQEIRNRILEILEVESENGYVHGLYEKFKDTLVHDMKEEDFADMYAQTVVYGLFSARCLDETQDDFSVEEAIELLPNTNPFLKSLMTECFGAESTSKLSFDELEIGNVVDLLTHTKTDEIIKDFNKQTGGGKEDPVIHFYEEFLTAYDKNQKVQRGVFYTPQPVVNFIVRAVDDILKNDFGYEDGLASDETKTIKIQRKSKNKVDGFYKMVDDVAEVPAVQILDPATGTGTFLRQTIIQIYENFNEKHKSVSQEERQKLWNSYVDKSLLPRLNGFELMMAPYAVAHMKLAMVLRDTGYDFSGNNRLNVFLTNTLEEPGVSNWDRKMWDDPLATESMEANEVKKNAGLNIIIGNPPYNVSSTNKNKWIQALISDYKEGLTEKKLNLDDDYIKFIRYAQMIIEGSSQGILAFITNNSFIDGVSHRRIRERLMSTFEQIYVFDLHGNAMKQEKTSSGEKDDNVFDITQGVSISIFIKKAGLPRFVKHGEIMGTRELKYRFLSEKSLYNINWHNLLPQSQEYLFIPYTYELKKEYEAGFKVSELFSIFNSGIQTKCDDISVCDTPRKAQEIVNMFLTEDIDKIRDKFPEKKDGRDWSFELAQKDVKNNDGVIVPYYYRPFDVKYIRYSGQTKGLVAYPRREAMNHIVNRENIALCMMKQFFQDVTYNHIFVTSLAIDERFLYSNRGGTYIFPLYRFCGEGILQQKEYNFCDNVIKTIENKLGKKLDFNETQDSFSGEQLIQYIYAILYSKKYREKYNDQLKYDFPSIPYPTDIEKFRELAKLGELLFELHMPTEYYIDDTSEIALEKLSSYRFENDYVVLNESITIEGFHGIKDFQMGGYRPADKWLKDRKGESISKNALEVYVKMIQAMKKTQTIMKKIDEIVDF